MKSEIVKKEKIPLVVVSIEELREDSKMIDLIADTYGFDSKEKRHLKKAYMLCKIDNGLVPDIFVGDFRSIYTMSILAEDMDCALVQVLRGGYFINGRWAWYAEFMIARVIGVGFFTSVNYESGGDLKDDTMWFRATGTRPDGEKMVGKTVSMKMAKEEGWVRNPKYKSMPAQMLTYRAATFMIRAFAPHVFGGNTREVNELEDIATIANRGIVVDATPSDEATTPEAITVAALKQKEDSSRQEFLAAVKEQIEEIKQRYSWNDAELNDELEARLVDIKIEDADRLPQNALHSLHKILTTEFNSSPIKV